MKTKLQTILCAGALLALPSILQAGPSPSFTSHYVPGVEGIKAASLPPPGFYLRDYNAFYTADRVNFANGDKIPVDFDAFIYANVIRGIWVSDWHVLGGNFAADVLVPLQYTSISINGARQSRFGLADICVEPAVLSWHGDRWDAALAYAFWAPTGESELGSAKPGKGFWGHMITAGATVYLDKEKTWAVSALNRYELNHEEKDTHITPGNQWTLEWGISKSIKPTIDVGVVGYYQLQTTKDSGAGASDNRDEVVAVGPEVNVFWPSVKLFTSLRYNYELMAKDRPQGHTIALTLTKIF
ncbi:MAG: transporter [Verrucomicrobia bacterium]|nr:transporter [Verrucomicrobiota bacterium]